CQKYDSAPFAF
nr:immunoglobulin light chain junction region [Macaca mulatta]